MYGYIKTNMLIQVHFPVYLALSQRGWLYDVWIKNFIHIFLCSWLSFYPPISLCATFYNCLHWAGWGKLCDISIRGTWDSLSWDDVCHTASSVLPHMFSLQFDMEELFIAGSRNQPWLIHMEREFIWRAQGSHKIKGSSRDLEEMTVPGKN
jgi:hypothetical protein